jgi:hypothetical protein
MKRICKFCIWWTEYTQKWDQKECGECKESHFIYTGNGEEIPLNGLGYWDGESYAAGFNTGSYFGCIHFVENKKITDELKPADEKPIETISPDELEIL